MMGVPIYVLVRLAQATDVVVSLIRDRELAKQLPWAYFRLLLRTNRWIQLQMFGMLSLLIIYPLSFALPESLKGVGMAVAFGLWAVGLAMRPLRARRH